MEQMGITMNISRRGICIATTEMFRRRSMLDILLAAADDIYALRGRVVWHMTRKDSFGDNVPVGIGIRIEEAAPGYYKYISGIRKGFISVPVSRTSC
jgi:hypothetical protein